MLNRELIERILTTIPGKSIGLIGDLFLDRYLDLDARLTEPSLETGLDAYQVVQVRSYPGALGTVLNNLVALGVGSICPIAVIGDDGEGYELMQCLRRISAVQTSGIISTHERRTPTYTKPMLGQPGKPARELNRLDIKNRDPLPLDLEERVLALLDERWGSVDAWLVLDQVSELNCGVITDRVRKHLALRAQADPDVFVLADSRERIRAFEWVHLKPNLRECFPDASPNPANDVDWLSAFQLAGTARRPLFMTCGEQGIWIIDAQANSRQHIAGFPVTGPTDTVGAGDSCSAGIACAMVSGCNLQQAAAFGNLVASITVQKLGTTGTASPNEVRERWKQVGRMEQS